MSRIFVCSGRYDIKDKEINKQARDLGKKLAEHKITYVQGGYATGTLGETLKVFIKKSKDVEFFIPHLYYDRDSANLKKLLGKKVEFKATKTEGEAGRLSMVKKCDHIIILPGGTGTLCEIMYSNEILKYNDYFGKVYLVNINGFYDNLIKQFAVTTEYGFTPPDEVMLKIVNSVYEIPFEELAK